MPQGYFLSWFATTQAEFRITATLKDECKTYFSESKASTNIDPPWRKVQERCSAKN